jgi:hypothetical protein
MLLVLASIRTLLLVAVLHPVDLLAVMAVMM